MAQTEQGQTGVCLAGVGKVRIKLKLPLSVRKPVLHGIHASATAPVDQLAELHAAVEAFCRQGVHGLPGCMLLSPWRETSPTEELLHEQQVNGLQQLQPARKRVRKRRVPEPGADDIYVCDLQQLQLPSWGQVKRARSGPGRSARSVLQLSTRVHSMLQQQQQQHSAGVQSPSVASYSEAAAAAAEAAAAAAATAAPAAGTTGHISHETGAARSQSRDLKPQPMLQHQPSFSSSPASAPTQPPAAEALQPMDIDVAGMSLTAVKSVPPAANTAPTVRGPVESATTQRPGSSAAVATNTQQPSGGHRVCHSKASLAAAHAAAASAGGSKAHALQAQQQSADGMQAAPTSAGHPRSPASEASAQQQICTAAPPDVEQLVSGKMAGHSAGAVLQGAIPPTATPAAAAATLASNAVPAGHQQAHQKEHQQAQQEEHQQQQQQQQQQLQQEQQQQAVSAAEAGAPQQHKQPEQTAVSRDRSQCSLPRAAEQPAITAVQGAGVVSTPVPAAAAALTAQLLAPSAISDSGRLLELAPGAATPAARALAGLSALPEVKQRILPPDDCPVRTQEEATNYLATIMSKAKSLKHQGDKRQASLGGWDVFGLAYYALSSVEFLLYWDTALKLLGKLRAAGQPVDKLQHHLQNLSTTQFLRQTGALCTTAMAICSNCKGPDMAKQALRMLLERLSAVTNMKHLHSQHKQLESHIRVLKSGGAVLGPIGGSSGSSSGQQRAPQQQQQQQQVRMQVPAQRATAMVAGASAKPPSPSGACSSSWSPQGQQQPFNKRSPDDSNASNQERLQLPISADNAAVVGTVGSAGGVGAAVMVAAGGGAGGAGPGGVTGGAVMAHERALHLAKSERLLMDTMQELLRMTDGMHQTVMRMQQFLESPDVLANEHARTAALHISVLGLDAGMFSLPRVAAHTEAAVMSIMKLLRGS